MSDEPKRTFTPREALAALYELNHPNKNTLSYKGERDDCLEVLAHEVEINEILQKHLEVIGSEENDSETIEAVTEDGIKIYPFDNNAPTNQEEFHEIQIWIFEGNFK
jgi:hypothetical protein